MKGLLLVLVSSHFLALSFRLLRILCLLLVLVLCLILTLLGLPLVLRSLGRQRVLRLGSFNLVFLSLLHIIFVSVLFF